MQFHIIVCMVQNVSTCMKSKNSSKIFESMYHNYCNGTRPITGYEICEAYFYNNFNNTNTVLDQKNVNEIK